MYFQHYDCDLAQILVAGAFEVLDGRSNSSAFIFDEIRDLEFEKFTLAFERSAFWEIGLPCRFCTCIEIRDISCGWLPETVSYWYPTRPTSHQCSSRFPKSSESCSVAASRESRQIRALRESKLPVN